MLIITRREVSRGGHQASCPVWHPLGILHATGAHRSAPSLGVWARLGSRGCGSCARAGLKGPWPAVPASLSGRRTLGSWPAWLSQGLVSLGGPELEPPPVPRRRADWRHGLVGIRLAKAHRTSSNPLPGAGRCMTHWPPGFPRSTSTLGGSPKKGQPGAYFLPPSSLLVPT